LRDRPRRYLLVSVGTIFRTDTNNARKGVDESVWAVQLVEHAGKEIMEEK
jgi:hypothetical protein